MNHSNTLSDQLSESLDFIRKVQNLANEINRLAVLPSGTGDQAEAETLYTALESLDALRDGSAESRIKVAGETFVEGLKLGADMSGRAFANLAQTIHTRLDKLAHNGVRPPNSLLTQDLRTPPIIAVIYNDEGTASPIIFAPSSSLPTGHPARTWVPEDRLYEHEGVKGLVLGVPLGTGEFATRYISPFTTRSTVVRWTQILRAPQVQSREDLKRSEEFRKAERAQAERDRKTPEVLDLEARVAQMEEELKDLKRKKT